MKKLVPIKVKRVCSIYSKKRKFQKQSFDNAVFIQDCYLGQTTFTRVGDERLVKELITYVIRRIKQVTDWFQPNEDAVDGRTYSVGQQNRPKRVRSAA